MTIYIFVEATPVRVMTSTSAAEALAIANEQSILGVRTSFSDDAGPLSYFELQAMAVAPPALAIKSSGPRTGPS